MKKSKNIVLIVTPVLSAALFNACGGSSQPSTVVTPPAPTPYPISTVAPETAQTRDVYNNLNDCVKDWGDKELCERMGEEDDKDYRKRYKTSRTGKFFYGPKYSSSNRIITYKGKTITPTGPAATKMPSFVSSAPSSKTTTTAATATTTRSTAPLSSTTTGKSTTSSSLPSSSTSSSSSTSTYSPSSSSSTTRSGFGSTSSSYSSSSSSSSSSGS